MGTVADTRPVRVLVVDDSALVRQLMSELLGADPGIEVVGVAADPLIARRKIKQLAPDVLTLDIEMPHMDGLTFLRNLMRLRPMPVVMVSTLTSAGADATLEALALGAVDFVPKPDADVANRLADYADLLRARVKAAATARVGRIDGPSPARPPALPRPDGGARLFAIGASTGGTEAIRELLSAMPADAPPIMVAQHIPAAFSAAFAERLDRHSAMHVAEAVDGEAIVPGRVYVAPGGRHLRVQCSGGRWRCRLGEDAPVNGHRPSVDVLFDSVLRCAGANAAAALLTGMGEDGACGLLALRNAGAVTIAQDRASSVVWGMPGAAVARGAACSVLPLAEIATALLAASPTAAGSPKPDVLR